MPRASFPWRGVATVYRRFSSPVCSGAPPPVLTDGGAAVARRRRPRTGFAARMRIFRHHTDLPVEARGAVVALGNFDGVHLGHKAVIAEAGWLARAAGVPHGVITFEPHPRRLFRPDDPSFRLSTLRTQMHWIDETGPDLLFVPKI